MTHVQSYGIYCSESILCRLIALLQLHLHVTVSRWTLLCPTPLHTNSKAYRQLTDSLPPPQAAFLDWPVPAISVPRQGDTLKWMSSWVEVTEKQLARNPSDCYVQHIMMTLWYGKVFCITGPLWGESTGDRWIPLKGASNAELWCFICWRLEQALEQTV